MKFLRKIRHLHALNLFQCHSLMVHRLRKMDPGKVNGKALKKIKWRDIQLLPVQGGER